jgi:hypothetical protein
MLTVINFSDFTPTKNCLCNGSAYKFFRCLCMLSQGLRLVKDRAHFPCISHVLFLSPATYVRCTGRFLSWSGTRSLASSLLSKSTKIEIHRIIILPVVLYGCGSLTLRKERRQRVSENRVLRRIFGPKRDDVTREWRKLHNRNLMMCTPHPIFFG